MTVVRIIICLTIRLWPVLLIHHHHKTDDGCQDHYMPIYPAVDSLLVHHHYKTDDSYQDHYMPKYPPVESLLVHHHHKTDDGCQNHYMPIYPAVDSCCCCCCRPHSTNVLPAESSTLNHVAASSLSPQVARKGSTLSGFVQRSRLEREVGRDLHSNKWEEV